jgi:hypothetical protein
MRSFLKFLLLGVCLILAGGGLLCGQDAAPADGNKPRPAEKAKDLGRKEKDKEKEKSDKKKKDKDKGREGEKERDKDKEKNKKKGGDSGDGRMSLPLEKDHPSKGLKIPYYDGQGNLQMVFTIGVANKLDADNVEMQEMQVETYNEEGEPEMTVNLPTSVLDLNTRVVTSKTKTTITREDFVITGDSVRFNTVTKQGTLVGNVHMTINNLNEEVVSKPAEPAPAPATPTNE